MFEDGGQRRDFVHVRDVAHANILALESEPSAGGLRAYNIASGEPHRVGQVAVALAKAYGGPDPIVTGEYRLGDVRHIVASPDRATTDLSFRSSIPFDEGMAEFAAQT